MSARVLVVSKNPLALAGISQALRQGAHDFIEQPLIIDQFIPLLREALKELVLRQTRTVSHHQPA
jgi:FixJ family two-component response regulator